jgi:hypothetical protein
MIKNSIRLLTFFMVSFIFNPANAISADDDWVSLASSKNGAKYFGKSGSGEITTIDKEKAVAVIYKFINSQVNNKVELGIIYAKVKDCKRGEGRIYYADMAGKIFDNSQFVIYGGTVASDLGDSLCLTLDQISGVKSSRENVDDMWVQVSDSSDAIIFIKKRSTEIKKEKAGVFGIATLRQFYKGQDKTIFEKVAVLKGDCTKQSGKVYFSELDFSKQYSENFVFGGGNVASSIVEVLCTAVFKNKT